MATFTIRSWNNANPEHMDCSESTAKARAVTRAQAEGSIVKLRDNTLEYVLTVYPDGSFGKRWQDDASDELRNGF